MLAQPPTESTERRRGDWGDRRLLLAAVLFSTALLLLLALAVLLFRDRLQQQGQLPTWGPVVAVRLIGLGLAAAVGLIVQLRSVGRARSRAKRHLGDQRSLPTNLREQLLALVGPSDPGGPVRHLRRVRGSRPDGMAPRPGRAGGDGARPVRPSAPSGGGSATPVHNSSPSGEGVSDRFSRVGRSPGRAPARCGSAPTVRWSTRVAVSPPPPALLTVPPAKTVVPVA